MSIVRTAPAASESSATRLPWQDKRKLDKLAKALGDKDGIETENLAALSGLKSLTFPRPARWQNGEKQGMAVKVIDPPRNEGMRVVEAN